MDIVISNVVPMDQHHGPQSLQPIDDAHSSGWKAGVLGATPSPHRESVSASSAPRVQGFDETTCLQ
jgi:hypothetical protein